MEKKKEDEEDKFNKEEFIEKLMKIKFAKFHDDGTIVLNSEKKKACEDLGIPSELFGLTNTRPPRWSDAESAEKIVELVTGAGFITDKRKINDNITVTVTSLRMKDREEIDNLVDEYIKEKVNITKTNALAKASNLTIAFGVRAINGKSTGVTFEDRIENMSNKSANFIDLLSDEYREFNIDVNNLITEGGNSAKK